MQHDIALIRLKKPIEYTDKIQPACLPKNKDKNYPEPGSISYIVGFGDTDENGTYPNVLMNAKVKVYEGYECNQTIYALNQQLLIENSSTLDLASETYLTGDISMDSASQICAGDKESVADSCQGKKKTIMHLFLY